jgi:hypothetical protein
MKYQDGMEIRVGDRVKLLNGELATVVASIDAGEYSEECIEENWADLGSGVVVKTDKGALVRFSEPNENEIIVAC